MDVKFQLNPPIYYAHMVNHQAQLISKTDRVAVTLQSCLLGFYAHAGFLNALLSERIRPVKISGSSSGALAAAAYASGLENASLKAFILNPQLPKSFKEHLQLLRVPQVLSFYQGTGVFGGGKAVRYLRKTLPVQKIEDANNAELSICVLNLSSEKKVICTEGDIASHVVASCAVTPLIAAQKINGESYIDGGFIDELPFDHWIDDPEIDVILAHRILSDDYITLASSNTSNFLTSWGAAHKLMADELLNYRLNKAREAGKKVILHDTYMPKPQLLSSLKKAEENYDHAFSHWKTSPSLVFRQDY